MDVQQALRQVVDEVQAEAGTGTAVTADGMVSALGPRGVFVLVLAFMLERGESRESAEAAIARFAGLEPSEYGTAAAYQQAASTALAAAAVQ